MKYFFLKKKKIAINLNLGYMCIVVLAMVLFGCSSSHTVRDDGIQLDPNLTELGELNALLLQYDDADCLSDEGVAVKSGKKWGLINLKGDTVQGFHYDNIHRREDYWILESKDIEGNEEVGLADANGKILISPNKENRDYIPISDNLLMARTRRDLRCFYDTKGDEAFICDIYDHDMYPDAVFYMKGNHYMASTGDETWQRMTYIPEEKFYQLDTVTYCAAKSGSPDMCAVMNEERKWGVIDTEGKTIVPFDYVDISIYDNIIVVANENGQYGRYEGDGVKKYYDSFYVCKGYSLATNGDTHILFDKQNKELLRTEEEMSAYFYSDGMFYSANSLFDEKGNVILHVDDSIHIDDYINGYITYNVYEAERGVMDKKGNIVLSASAYKVYIEQDYQILRIRKYEEIDDDFVETTDIFDTKNNKITHTDFSMENFNSQGLARAEVAGRHLYINAEGKFGIENFEEIMGRLMVKQAEVLEEEQTEKEKHIKQLLLDIIQKEGYKTNSIHNLTKGEDGLYSAKFYTETVYSTTSYDVTGIIIENDEIVECRVTQKQSIPKKDAPDYYVPQNVDELIKHINGVPGY